MTAILIVLHVVCVSVFGIAGHHSRRPVERCMERIVTMARTAKFETRFLDD